MSTPARFSDEEYKNWLKCSLSLIIMKEALHNYTDNEVRKLHCDITQKVSSIPCASSTGNQCGSCSSGNIKLKGNPKSWFISCKNNICDKWLQQILHVHENSDNRSINWKNADISLWPVDCYQVAKIFMPKGQDKTVTMPDDLDAPAVLSLLKYCNWFRKDLPKQVPPQNDILSELIDFRNTTLHSGDLKVSNGDKDSKMDLMIQLLKDLKIQGDAISNLETLKKEDIDINFRENEIRLLQKMVSGLVNDIDTVKADMATVQNSMSDLSENMDKMRHITMETIGEVDVVKTDMEGIRKSLKEHRVIYDKMVLFLDTNSIHDSEIRKNMTSIEMDIKNLQGDLSKVEKELKALEARVSSLEKYREENNVEMKCIKEKVERVEKISEETKEEMGVFKRRLTAVEKQSLQTETTRNEIPDSEDLRKLKTCGVPEFSSDNPIHQSRSSNAVLEGTGDKYNNTSNLISSMSSISLQDTKYVLKEHFDACIIYCEDDEDDAYGFKDHIEKLDLGLGEHPKICLYTEEKVWGPSKLTERAMFVCKHCTLIFVYLSKRSSLDEYAYFFRNEVVMATIKNSRVRPVLSEKDCIIPCGLYNAPRIEFYKQESRSYKENILSLFVMNKPERLRREAKSEESILSTL